MTRALVLMLAGLVAACGGDGSGEDASWRLAGVWEGPVDAVPSPRPGAPTATEVASWPMTLHVAVTGPAVDVSGICPDGSGHLVLDGEGTEAYWRGALVCPRVPLFDCSSVAVEVNTLTLALGTDERVHADMVGVVYGCGLTRTAALRGAATRQ